MTNQQIDAATKNFSKNAADMWKIAVHLANFEPVALLAEITRGQRRYGKVSVSTVLAAMQTCENRYRGRHPDEYIEIDRLRDQALGNLMDAGR